MKYEVLDLELVGIPGAISSYFLPDGEPALVDPGPSTTLDALERGLREHGAALGDLRHVILTHVHLDHAGVTGHLTEAVPDLVVHVHADGAPHLSDPARLVASTRRTFGDDHDRLWGEVRPVPRDRIRPWGPGGPGPLPQLRPLPTPGHIDHHLAYLDEEGGTLFAGDAMGIVLAPGAPTHPPTPPPSLDVSAWLRTLERLGEVQAERAAVAHFGVHGRFDERRRALVRGLVRVRERVRAALEEGDEADARRYEEEVREAQAAHLPRGRARRYFEVFGAAIDWMGVKFYLERNPDA